MKMIQELYFVDTCIWLNLFKKEGDETKGIPYWKIAKDFFEKVIFTEKFEIYYSGFILKELKFIINDDNLFREKLNYMEDEFRFVKATSEDYDFARKLESEFKYEISFFDCTHIAISKRLNCILVTRDKELLGAARKHIKAHKPEELIS